MWGGGWPPFLAVTIDTRGGPRDATLVPAGEMAALTLCQRSDLSLDDFGQFAHRGGWGESH